MFKILKPLKSFPHTSPIRYHFSSSFKKQFGLGPLKASLSRRLYRRFIKSLNTKYLIPVKIFAAGLFCFGLLLIIPGVGIHGQKSIKEAALGVVDQFQYYIMKQGASPKETNRYIISLFTSLEYWDNNGVNTTDKTNQVLGKVLNVVQHFPITDETFTNLIMMLELRLRKLVEINKETLKAPKTYENIYGIVESYVKYREGNAQSGIEKNLFYTRREFVEFIWDYILKYEVDESKGSLQLLNRFLIKEEMFRQSVITFHPILKQLIGRLNGSQRKQVIQVFQTISRDQKVREQMLKINLINNLKQYIPQQQIKGVLSNF